MLLPWKPGRLSVQQRCLFFFFFCCFLMRGRMSAVGRWLDASCRKDAGVRAAGIQRSFTFRGNIFAIIKPSPSDPLPPSLANHGSSENRRLRRLLYLQVNKPPSARVRGLAFLSISQSPSATRSVAPRLTKTGDNYQMQSLTRRSLRLPPSLDPSFFFVLGVVY